MGIRLYSCVHNVFISISSNFVAHSPSHSCLSATLTTSISVSVSITVSLPLCLSSFAVCPFHTKLEVQTDGHLLESGFALGFFPRGIFFLATVSPCLLRKASFFPRVVQSCFETPLDVI